MHTSCAMFQSVSNLWVAPKWAESEAWRKGNKRLNLFTFDVRRNHRLVASVIWFRQKMWFFRKKKNEAGEESQPTNPADSRADCWSAAEVSATRLTDFRNSLHGTRHERTDKNHSVSAILLQLTHWRMHPTCTSFQSHSTRSKRSTAKNDEDNNTTRRPSTFWRPLTGSFVGRSYWYS